MTDNNKSFYSGIKLEIVTHASQDVKDLLSSTVYGTKGGMRYRHKNASEKIEKLSKPYFVTLRRFGVLMGISGFMFRHSSCNQKFFPSYYVRYLSISNRARIKESPEKIKKKDSKKRMQGHIKSGLNNLLHEFFTAPLSDKNEPSVFYAYIEQKNEYSQNLSKIYSYEKIRKLNTLIFSRLSPKKHSSVLRSKPEEKEWLLSRLAQEYKLHTFYFKEHTFIDDNYFIYKENNTITAGIKALPVEWEILSIPGFSGMLIQKLFPLFPFLSKLFNAKSMRFAAFEAAWCDEGCEQQLIDLMESVCAEMKLNMGMLWTDSECVLSKILQATGKLGLLNKLKKNIPTDIVAKFVNMSSEDKKIFYTSPAYISAFDLT